MKRLIASAVCGYLVCAALIYGCMVGDSQYLYEREWTHLCPSASDYAGAIMFAAIPICWPAAAATAIGHKINEGTIPFEWRIHVDRCENK